MFSPNFRCTILRSSFMGKWKYGFFFLVILHFQIGMAQNIPDDFIRVTDSLIESRAKTYAELDALLRPSRKDTILMRYFAEEAGKEKYYSGQAYALNQLGRRYRDLSQFTKAINMHQGALDAAIAGENLEFKVYSLNMLGVIYRRKDAINTALDYNQEALELAETVEEPSEGLKRSINVSLNSIGNL